MIGADNSAFYLEADHGAKGGHQDEPNGIAKLRR